MTGETGCPNASSPGAHPVTSRGTNDRNWLTPAIYHGENLACGKIIATFPCHAFATEPRILR